MGAKAGVWIGGSSGSVKGERSERAIFKTLFPLECVFSLLAYRTQANGDILHGSLTL